MFLNYTNVIKTILNKLDDMLDFCDIFAGNGSAECHYVVLEDTQISRNEGYELTKLLSSNREIAMKIKKLNAYQIEVSIIFSGVDLKLTGVEKTFEFIQSLTDITSDFLNSSKFQCV